MALVRPPEAAASAGGVGKDAPERAPSRPWGDDGRGRLRILMLTAEPPSATARGGRPQVTNAALVELAKRHDVTLVTQAGGDPADAAAIAAWVAAGVRVDVIWWPRVRGLALQRRRVRLVWDWLTSRRPWQLVLYRDDGVETAIKRRSATTRFDLVLVEDNVMAQYVLPEGVPRILTEHEVRRPGSGSALTAAARRGPPAVLRALDWGRWRRYHAATWQRFDRVQLFTPEDLAVAAAMAPQVASRLRVNPAGIEIPDAKPSAAGTEAGGPEAAPPETIVFVGAMSHPPNVDAAIWLGREILPRLRQLRPGVRLDIVGHSPPPDVTALASGDVRVTGAVERVEPFLEPAALVVAPVRIGGGLRTKILQAMAFGKPVVTTRRGAFGLESAIGRGLIVADAPDEFASRCVELLADGPARAALGSAARAYVVERHSPAAFVDRLEATIGELVGATRSA